MQTLQIKNTTIHTIEELSCIYTELMANQNNYFDISTDLLLDSESVLPESITISKGNELIDDIYFNDEFRQQDYLSIIDGIENGSITINDFNIAFHYGASNYQLDLNIIIDAIKNRKNEDYFLSIMVSNSENSFCYDIKI